MKLFGFGNKLANKLAATKFVFTFTIHNLNPWPHAQRAIAVGWQRGKKKRGATRSVYPSSTPGRIGSVVRFNEKFEVPASLYKASNGSSHASSKLGPFKKKCIILAVLETDGRTQATAALGRVVIDLAEFAAIEQQETRMFQVSCNKSIHAAVGDPQLTVSIRCRWKNSSATAANSQESVIDDMGSISTDTTGSRMTANLSSFLRFKHNHKGQANEEQDLQGFDAAACAKIAKDKGMGTIQEGPDESPDVKPVVAQASYANGTTSPTESSPTGAKHDSSQEYRNSVTALNSGIAAMALSSDQQLQLGGLSASASASSLRESTCGARSGEDGLTRGKRETDELATRASLTPARSGGSDLGDLSRSSGPSTYTELLTIAATEVCVYLARISSQGRKPARNMHAMARRVARTMVCLGQNQGTAFGRQVISMVEAQAHALGPDLAGVVFFWSNMVHLRGMLQVLGNPEYAVGSLPSMRWASDTLIPELLRLERSVLFEQIIQQLWATLMTHVEPGNSAAAATKGAAVTKRALQEAAIKQWFTGLDALSQQLTSLGSRGHMLLLRQQVLLQCLKRLDALLFFYLLTDEAGSQDLLQDYNLSDTLWGPPGAAVPEVAEACLPFSRGLLTFGSGMSVKMTVTRLQQWASSAGLSENAHGTPSMQFPLLRTTADLLMMPKELLLEPAIRNDVKQALSTRSMVHILENFQTDEYAQDSIAPEVIATLRDEQAVAPSTRPPLSDLSLGYRAPPEDAIIQKGTVPDREPGVEYDGDSERELEDLGLLVGGGQGVPSRVRMLHQLWALGVPRKRL